MDRHLEGGSEPEFRLWATAKACLAGGTFTGADGGRPVHRRNGVVAVPELVRRLAGLPGKPLGDRRNVRLVLAKGAGTYWDLDDRGRVRFPSPDTLAKRVGLPHAGHRLTPYPVGALRKGVGSFRDLLRDSVQPNSPQRLSRVAQSRRQHTSATTQKRREREGKALYHDGAGVVPVASRRTFIDLGLLSPNHVSRGETAREFAHEGLFSDGRRVLRQAPKTFQSSIPSKRRTPKSPAGHRVKDRAPGRRLVSYDARKGKARVQIVPTADPSILEAVPRGLMTVDQYFAARDWWAREQSEKGGRVIRTLIPDLTHRVCGPDQPELMWSGLVRQREQAETLRRAA